MGEVLSPPGVGLYDGGWAQVWVALCGALWARVGLGYPAGLGGREIAGTGAVGDTGGTLRSEASKSSITMTGDGKERDMAGRQTLLTLRVTPELMRYLTVYAEHLGVSRSTLVREAIRDKIKALQAERGANV